MSLLVISAENPPRFFSLTEPQYRMLGRAIRGAKLPISRYRFENSTVYALFRKGCWVKGHTHWEYTRRGALAFSNKGKELPATTTYE